MPSLKTFVAKVSHAGLVSELLRHQKLELPKTASALDSKELFEAVDAAMSSAMPGTAGAIDRLIERITRLSDEAGATALEEATDDPALSQLPSKHARALYVFLNDRAAFRHAEEIVYTDSRRGNIREWTMFAVAKHSLLSRDSDALESFKQKLKSFFDTPNVHVEIIERDRIEADEKGEGGTRIASLVQLTIYREDRPDTELAFDQEGNLGTEVRRKVLEAALTYEYDTGVIECVARQRDSRKEMARILAVTLLGYEPEFQPTGMRAYDLTVLRQRLAFDHEPVDRIQDVSVTMLTITPKDSAGIRIRVESTPAKNRDIWTVTDDCLGSGALLNDYQINQARIVIRYNSGESGHLRSLPIVITHPGRSSLKELTAFERTVSTKYLPRWGLVAQA
ncbi:hypothetical protein [Mesorhizobium sp. IMUNJ 23232]|uniref:hypothetical protein n=1 Tax=Mesorhizobium sp. IMUNJ 23232 TaxID=3376064 RepID=UPI00379A0F54